MLDFTKEDFVYDDYDGFVYADNEVNEYHVKALKLFIKKAYKDAAYAEFLCQEADRCFMKTVEAIGRFNENINIFGLVRELDSQAYYMKLEESQPYYMKPEVSQTSIVPPVG
jgi:hypothetical protein